MTCTVIAYVRLLCGMPDDSLLWTHKPASPRQRRPGDVLWSVRKGDESWTCELRFHGETVGWEAQILRDGDLANARTFSLRDLAIGWAKNERDRLETEDPLL